MEYQGEHGVQIMLCRQGVLISIQFLLDLSLAERFHVCPFKEKLKYLSSEKHLSVLLQNKSKFMGNLKSIFCLIF